MNVLILISGLVAGFTTVGHFTMGSKNYLKPILDASIDDVPKKVMHSVFHYISVFLVLSTLFLILIGAGVKFELDTSLLVRFIAYNYLLFAIAQVIVASTSKIEKPFSQLFQWTLFAAIAVLALLGVML